MAGWQRLEETLNSNCDRAESDLEQQLAVVKIERDGLAAIVKELQAANAKLRKCVEELLDFVPYEKPELGPLPNWICEIKARAEAALTKARVE